MNDLILKDLLSIYLSPDITILTLKYCGYVVLDKKSGILDVDIIKLKRCILNRVDCARVCSYCDFYFSMDQKLVLYYRYYHDNQKKERYKHVNLIFENNFLECLAISRKSGLIKVHRDLIENDLVLKSLINL